MVYYNTITFIRRAHVYIYLLLSLFIYLENPLFFLSQDCFSAAYKASNRYKIVMANIFAR